ncbi:MAG: hypothetical protein HKN07_10750 [Acidimicrobiia bacterium]|nr:hypothetical protein [Acidimicrobiia bacterium]
MPIHLSHTVRVGTTGRSIFMFGRDPSGRPATGVHAADSHVRAGYVRSGAEAIEISVVPGQLGRWSAGSFTEVNAQLMPGVYQFDVPDELMAEGATNALLTLQADSALFDPIEFTLVAYDPNDARALGLVQLQQSTRHDFLKRALPRFTEMDLALSRGDASQALTAAASVSNPSPEEV